jgi:hypothetical protein
MKIDVTKAIDGTYTVDVYLDKSPTKCYSQSGIALLDVGGILVQSHWGSGVVFSNVGIAKK